MKKWITKTEIKKILDVYSVRKNEFIQVANINYCYQSSLVKGYMITLSEGSVTANTQKQVIITHSQDDGKRTYTDIWERGKDGLLKFRFRNLKTSPSQTQNISVNWKKPIKNL